MPVSPDQIRKIIVLTESAIQELEAKIYSKSNSPVPDMKEVEDANIRLQKYNGLLQDLRNRISEYPSSS
jgi:hypothetical protein